MWKRNLDLVLSLLAAIIISMPRQIQLASDDEHVELKPVNLKPMQGVNQATPIYLLQIITLMKELGLLVIQLQELLVTYFMLQLQMLVITLKIQLKEKSTPNHMQLLTKLFYSVTRCKN